MSDIAERVKKIVVEHLGVDRYHRLRTDLAAKLVTASHRWALPALTELSAFVQWDSIRDQRGGTVTYGVAFFAVEYLISKRGHEAVVEYFRLFASSQDRLANFRLAFGIDFEEFEREFSLVLNETLGVSNS